MTQSLALILAVATVTGASAQSADTTSAWRYFPLAVGNTWDYESSGGTIPTTTRRHTVTADSVVSGERFFRLEWTGADIDGSQVSGTRFALVRFDTTLGGLRVLAEEGTLPEQGAFNCGVLAAPFGAGFPPDPRINCELGPYAGSPASVTTSGGYDRPVEVGADVVRTSVKEIDTQANGEARTAYAAGIGYLGYIRRSGALTLRYAKINGVEYGTPLAVAIDPVPRPVQPLAIEARPTVSDRTITVRVSSVTQGAGRVALFDLTGRQVATWYEGEIGPATRTITADVSGLTASVYVVRVVQGSASSTARVVVVR